MAYGNQLVLIFIFRRDFQSPLAASLVSSAVNLLFEAYLLFRLYHLIVPGFLLTKHRRDALLDSRMVCAACLVLLDLLTMMSVLSSRRFLSSPRLTPRRFDPDFLFRPHAIPVNVAADTTPFSLGIVFVLGAFSINSS